MSEPHPLILVANRTCPCPGLADEIHDWLDGRPGRVHIVAPALNKRLQHYLSDSDEAFRQAHSGLRSPSSCCVTQASRDRGRSGTPTR